MSVLLLRGSVPVPTELGDGPFSLVSAANNNTVIGVNRSSNSVFPLLRDRSDWLPAPGLLFNFMVTAGLQKDRNSREPLHHHRLKEPVTV